MGVLHAGEARRVHPDNRESPGIDCDYLTDDRWRAAKALCPEVVADDYHCAAAGHGIIGRKDGAAQRRRDPECLEVVAGDHLSLYDLGFTVDGGGQASCVLEGNEILEDFILLAQLLVDGIRKGGAGDIILAGLVPIAPDMMRDGMLCRSPAKETQLCGMWDGKAVEQHMPGYAENGSVCADAKRQRSDGDYREPRRLRQHAEGVAQVGAEVV